MPWPEEQGPQSGSSAWQNASQNAAFNRPAGDYLRDIALRNPSGAATGAAQASRSGPLQGDLERQQMQLDLERRRAAGAGGAQTGAATAQRPGPLPMSSATSQMSRDTLNPMQSMLGATAMRGPDVGTPPGTPPPPPAGPPPINRPPRFPGEDEPPGWTGEEPAPVRTGTEPVKPGNQGGLPTPPSITGGNPMTNPNAAPAMPPMPPPVGTPENAPWFYQPQTFYAPTNNVAGQRWTGTGWEATGGGQDVGYGEAYPDTEPDYDRDDVGYGQDSRIGTADWIGGAVNDLNRQYETAQAAQPQPGGGPGRAGGVTDQQSLLDAINATGAELNAPQTRPEYTPSNEGIAQSGVWGGTYNPNMVGINAPHDLAAQKGQMMGWGGGGPQWHPPGQAAPPEEWQYDLDNGWIGPGQQADPLGTQVSMGPGFDPRSRGGGVSILMSPPGQQAPVDRHNWTPSASLMTPPGQMAPADQMNLSLMAA